MATKATERPPALGDKGYEVEWCPITERNRKNSERDQLDRLQFEYAYFTSRDEAIACAKKKCKKSLTGVAMVRAATFVDPYNSGMRHTFRFEADENGWYFEAS